MKHFFTLTLLCLLVLGLRPASAQEVLIDGEFRPRFEYRQGFKAPLPDSLQAVGIGLQRTRLGAAYKSNDLMGQFTIQDCRIFGATDTKNTASLGVYEAWAELLLLRGFSVKIGRQGVQLEDGRLFSTGPWSNTGTAHDLAMFKFATSTFKANLAVGYSNPSDDLSEGVYSISGMYKNIEFLWLQKTAMAGLNVSLLGVNEGFQSGTTPTLLKQMYFRKTVGGTIELKNDSIPLSFLITMYHQLGQSAATTNLNANLFAIKATNKFSSSFALTLGADYYSGTSPNTASNQNNTFNKLYGVNHIFNGYMEYWGTLPKGGLIDYFGGISYPGAGKLGAEATFHKLSLAQDMVVSKQTVNHNLGSELDLVINYKVNKISALQFGYCMYYLSDATKAIKNITVDNQLPQYTFLMLTIKPQFFKTPEVK